MPSQSVEVLGPHRLPEPEVYVKIHPRGLSCETPPHHLSALLRQFAIDLHAKKITLRYHTEGDLQEESYSRSDFSARLEQLVPFLKDQPVVIEYGSKGTLYSNGGGCLWLSTSGDVEVKKTLARHVLEISGYPQAVTSGQFTALVREGRLEILSS